MTYRSFTPLSTRKSPAFRGKSLQLDGVSDFIDLQGEYCGAYRHASYRSTANSSIYSWTHPCSWSFWVKFPQSTIDDVLANHASGGDMKHFIIKMHAANTEQNWYSNNSANGYWSGAQAGLACDGSGNVRFAGARGWVSGDEIQQRAIRRSTSSTVNANTWYNVIFVWNGNSSITGIKIFVNGTEQNLAIHYPAGVSSGELSSALNQSLPRWYSYPWAPNVSIPNLENLGAGNPATHVANYHVNAEHSFACYIGRNASDYTAMTIHDAAFWAKTALDTDDATGIWSRQNINLTQYHVNTDDAGGSNAYHQGEDGHATVPDIGVIAKYQNLEITLTSGLETKTYLFADGDSSYNTFGETGYGIIAGSNASFNGKIYVNISSTSSGNTFSQSATGTRWKTAINNLHNGLTAELNGAAGFISITQDQGGWHMSSSPVTYNSNNNLPGYVNTSTSAGPPTAFDTNGIDRLHSVFKFRGKRNDQSLSTSLQSTDNRISEYNENTSTTPGVNSIDPSTNRTEHQAEPIQSWNRFLNYLPYNTLPALNNGGLWVSDIPGDTQ